MKFGDVKFGSIEIDGRAYSSDVVIDSGNIKLRNSRPSNEASGGKGHTPLSIKERIPWNCKKLFIGTGMYGSLPVLDEVKEEAKRRSVDIFCEPTPDMVKRLKTEFDKDSNAILHLTC